MDQIKIENLEVFAKHGVFPEENVLGQKFLISACLHTDTRRAGRKETQQTGLMVNHSAYRNVSRMRCHPNTLLARSLPL